HYAGTENLSRGAGKHASVPFTTTENAARNRRSRAHKVVPDWRSRRESVADTGPSQGPATGVEATAITLRVTAGPASSRSLPCGESADKIPERKRRVRLVVRTQPSQGWYTGSTPVRAASFSLGLLLVLGFSACRPFFHLDVSV